MKVAFTYNLRRTDSEDEAEFDTAETVEAVATAIEAAGHEVEKIEVSGPASNLLERLESSDPDIIFNTAEGSGGRMREAFYPALFEELGVPYTGSDAYAMAVTLDKWLTKLVLQKEGIDTPRSRLVNGGNVQDVFERGPGLAFPIIVKPNYEGSSKGIAENSVANDLKELTTLLKAAVKAFPDGLLIEEYIEGIDVAVGYIHGVGHDDGLLQPVELMLEPSTHSPFNIYDYRRKNLEPGSVHLRCPANIPRDVAARLRAIAHEAIRALGLKDLARLDFRVADDGRIYLLEANAIPSLNAASSLFAATAQLGMSFDATIAAVLNSAALRSNVATAHELGVRRRQRGRHKPIRVGFTYNVKREAGEGDEQAEWDPPETIIAISNALARQGHIVVHLEATPDLPRVLAEADVDLIFNIAEGVEGRNREGQVPALCELLGIPYTGSDSATLAIALDKALCKKVLTQHDILTPKFMLMETGRERLDPELTFPLIVKPNAEGSSKGIGTASVVDNEDDLREKVAAILDRYKQPALVEEYICGREFTVGLLGNKRPRVLPPMEIRFKDPDVERPVYDYVVKQEWEKHVQYQCPAQLTDTELKAIEKIARATFQALDCRDFARVDIRMDESGQIYVFEVNPLPGLTPGYSDLVLISKAAGMDYDQLMAEIIVGGLKRLREKERRERQEEEEANAAEPSRPVDLAAAKAQKAAEQADKAEKAAKQMAKLARKRKKSRRNAARKLEERAAAKGSSGQATGNGSSAGGSGNVGTGKVGTGNVGTGNVGTGNGSAASANGAGPHVGEVSSTTH